MAAALVLGACAEAPLSTAPASPMGPSGPSQLLVPVSGSYAQMDAGFLHTCAVSLAGAVTCWGVDNADGRTTVPLAAQSGIAQVSAGDTHTCALSTAAGAVTCWGGNASGQANVPLSAESGIAQVSAGASHTCAVTSAGAVTCWGDNSRGQTNVPPAALSGVVQVSAGTSHTCALSTARTVTCWGGDNFYGQTSVPPTVQGDVVQVSAGGEHTCALSTVTTITCWGDNSQGQTSMPLAALSGITEIDAGFLHTCAVTAAGAVTCWGWSSGFGQATVPPAAQSGIAQVSAGGYHTCALSTAGAVTCWGDNRFGQTKVPSTTTRVLPTATFGAPTAHVVSGQSFTLTLTGAQVPGYPLATAFTYAFDCGGGSYTTPSTTASASCPTSAAGVLAVRGKVIDAHGDLQEYTASVTVLSPALTPAQATSTLRDQVLASTLIPDLRRALTAKLDDALKAFGAGKTKPACSALADFAKQVQAQRGKAIPTATADAWLAETAAIRKAAGC